MRGGRREGAGRPPGALNKRTSEIAAKCAEQGVTPLEYLLAVMRDADADPARRLQAAVASAPYLHPRLAVNINAGADPFGIAEEHSLRERLLAKLGLTDSNDRRN